MLSSRSGIERERERKREREGRTWWMKIGWGRNWTMLPSEGAWASRPAPIVDYDDLSLALRMSRCRPHAEVNVTIARNMACVQ